MKSPPGGDSPELRRRLQVLCREKEKQRILEWIIADMAVCEMEGWSVVEYIIELVDMLNGLINKTKEDRNE